MTPENENLPGASRAFAAMGSEPRLAVMMCLVRAGRTGLVVGDIQSRTGIPASTLNHHLKFLEAADIVAREKNGRTIINRARFDQLEMLANFILRQCCVDETAQLAVSTRNTRPEGTKND